MKRRRPNNRGNQKATDLQRDADSLLFELTRLQDAPIGVVFAKLEEGLAFTRSAFSSGGLQALHFEAFVSQVRTMMQILPAQFDVRFLFDAQMLQAIRDSWNGGQQKLSNMIIPCLGDEWSHQRAFLPEVRKADEPNLVINLIHFPRSHSSDDIDLLSYPFLCHELAHNLYFYDDSFFTQCSDKKLDDFLAKLRLRSISDSGAAKTRNKQLRGEIETYWRTTPNHDNWAHEIAMDVVALWTCGPAYLAAFCDETDDEQTNWFLIGKEHPPYTARSTALIYASQQLGWKQEAADIEQMFKRWRRSKHRIHIDNHYIALTEPRLIEACVDCVLENCRSQNLPRCNQSEVKRVRQLLIKGETPDWGTELIIAAWLKHKIDERGYESWQSAVIRDLQDSLTQ